VVLIIAVMLALSFIQALFIEPAARELKRRIVSFESTLKDDPLRRQFARLHGVSAVCNLLVVAGGLALVVLF
jgi:hypothetical protein